jgi:predicted GNAT family N-acyltransferase
MQEYVVKACSITDLDDKDRAVCVAIIKSGEAVDSESVEVELPLANAVAIARINDQIVGVGVIKRPRTGYAFDKALRSGEAFAPDTQELGYIIVAPDHRGKGLSNLIVEALLLKNGGPLFAMTTNSRLKKTLAKSGFTQKGGEWKGQMGQISLWIRE